MGSFFFLRADIHSRKYKYMKNEARFPYSCFVFFVRHPLLKVSAPSAVSLNGGWPLLSTPTMVTTPYQLYLFA